MLVILCSWQALRGHAVLGDALQVLLSRLGLNVWRFELPVPGCQFVDGWVNPPVAHERVDGGQVQLIVYVLESPACDSGNVGVEVEPAVANP